MSDWPQATLEKQDNSRIKSIDGLRGLAIVLVVGFHTYARWPSHIPWVTLYKDVSTFKYGFLGVELFFLISGFVIYRTLEKCTSFKEFLYRRWLRLFPAMFCASFLIYFSSFYLAERPGGSIKILDMISGMLFIEDELLNKLQSFYKIKTIEGSFWSLFVEIKFYIVFGALYFYKPSKALLNLVLIFLTYFVCSILFKYYSNQFPQKINEIFSAIFSLRYIGWFCVGAAQYMAYSTQKRIYKYASFLLMLPTSWMMSGNNSALFAACWLVFIIFYLAINNKIVSTLFSSKNAVFIGFISYPLYLIHENALVALTIKTRNLFSFLPDFYKPLPVIIVISTVAYLIANFVEPKIRDFIEKYLGPKKNTLAVNSGNV